MKLQREDIHPLQDTCPYFACCLVFQQKGACSEWRAQPLLEKETPIRFRRGFGVVAVSGLEPPTSGL